MYNEDTYQQCLDAMRADGICGGREIIRSPMRDDVIAQYKGALSRGVGDQRAHALLAIYAAHCELAKPVLIPPHRLGEAFFDDPLASHLDDTKPLALPAPLIAIEFKVPGEPGRNQFRSSRRVVIAADHGEYIRMGVLAYFDQFRFWQPQPFVGIPKVGCFDRSRPNEKFVGVRVALPEPAAQFGLNDYMAEVRALLETLSALNDPRVKVTDYPRGPMIVEVKP